MITNDNKKLAQWAMEFATKNGCQSSRVSIYNSSSSSFSIRNMKIDQLQQESQNSMVIQLFVDGRYGSFSTNRLEKKELEKFIKDGIATTRFLAEDKARTLPDASLYYKGGKPDLELFDKSIDSMQPDDKVALAMSTCDEMMGKDDRIISAESYFADYQGFIYMVASNGFEGDSSNSSFNLSASVSIKGEGEARPSDAWFDSAIFYEDLTKTGIGTQALERTLRKLGQRKTASGKYMMLVDNLNASQLLSPMINSLYGSSIQQKTSFLLNKIGQKVGSDKFTLIDEPHLKKTRGARYFDSEGIATKHNAVFENGELKTYFIDTYSANKTGLKQTVNSPSTLTMSYGNKDLEGLIASLDKGILVTGFNGGNNNNTTGDFSYGISGFLIEKGKLTQPVSEMNITGNMITLWNNLVEVGNDPTHFASWKIPTLLFSDVDFSGL